MFVIDLICILMCIHQRYDIILCVLYLRAYISLLSDSESGSEHDGCEDKHLQQAIAASLQDVRYKLLHLQHNVCFYDIILFTEMTVRCSAPVIAA